jgi:hypothetical protein
MDKKRKAEKYPDGSPNKKKIQAQESHKTNRSFLAVTTKQSARLR